MQEMFLNNGYKPYEADNKYFMQKCIRNEHGKKYFINVNMFDMRRFNKNIESLSDFAYDADVQFNTVDEETFEVKLFEVINPKQVENFFERVWKNMTCEYYDAE